MRQDVNVQEITVHRTVDEFYGRDYLSGPAHLCHCVVTV